MRPAVFATMNRSHSYRNRIGPKSLRTRPQHDGGPASYWKKEPPLYIFTRHWADKRALFIDLNIFNCDVKPFSRTSNKKPKGISKSILTIITSPVEVQMSARKEKLNISFLLNEKDTQTVSCSGKVPKNLSDTTPRIPAAAQKHLGHSKIPGSTSTLQKSPNLDFPPPSSATTSRRPIRSSSPIHRHHQPFKVFKCCYCNRPYRLESMVEQFLPPLVWSVWLWQILETSLEPLKFKIICLLNWLNIFFAVSLVDQT